MTVEQTREVHTLDQVVIRFAGDSGDGIQLTGDRFTAQSAAFGNDLATLPSYPAEIRAPAGTVAGVSSFQVQFSSLEVLTPGDRPDALIAMNPAALRANLHEVCPGGVVIVDTHDFTSRSLARAGYDQDPRTDGSLDGYLVHALDLTELTTAAVSDLDLSRKEAARAKNMFALGLVSWLYSRPIESTVAFLAKRFGSKPKILAGNLAALRAGWNLGETTETFAVTYQVKPARLPAGRYRNIQGNTAMAYGLVAAAERAAMPLFLGAYPITPATDVLHELSKLKSYGVRTFQAEDEIAAIGAAIGASYAGMLGVTVTSGPGMALKGEMLGLAVMLEIPLVVVNVQRGGPSTGLPTKTEQSDLFQAMYGRNGESPIPVLAASSPADCFDIVVEACRTALTYRTPVIVLSDGYLANGSQPWRVPDLDELPDLRIDFATEPNGLDENGEMAFLPYARDPITLARPMALPGTPGLQHRIGGLEKDVLTGDVSYDGDNHHVMTQTRQEKVEGIDVPYLEVDDPGSETGSRAGLLVLGWGSTYGVVGAACRQVRGAGLRVAQAHLRHLNPLPANLEEVLRRYDQVLVPEMNLGQLASIVRSTCVVDVISYAQTRGRPFQVDELERVMVNVITEGADRK